MIDWDFNYYAKKDGTIKPVEVDHIWQVNEDGWDLYWTPQRFNGFGLRKKSELHSVRCICGDFDNVGEEDFKRKLKNIPLPTLVCKTRNGFHAYWALRSPIINEPGIDQLYRVVVEDFLLPLGADPQAKDVSRLLRVPTSRYWSDSKNNSYKDECIIVEQLVYEPKRIYWLDDLWKLKKQTHTQPQNTYKAPARTFHNPDGGSFWKAANCFDCREGLQILSGSPEVRGERYGFKVQSGITRIFCNNKPSNAWLDVDGLIGSTVGAGPTLVNWLMYYGNSESQVAKIMKSLMGWKDEK